MKQKIFVTKTIEYDDDSKEKRVFEMRIMTPKEINRFFRGMKSDIKKSPLEYIKEDLEEWS